MSFCKRLFRAAAAGMALSALLTLAACNQPALNDRPPQPGDTAVAKVAGETVWASDVKNEAVAQGLIGEGEPLDTASDLFHKVMEEVIDQKLLAREAKKRGLDKAPLAQRRLAAARDHILGHMLVENDVDRNIDENAVRALYNEQLRLAKQTEEIHARLILVKTQAEAQSIVGLLANGASFEALATERSIDQNSRFNSGDLGYFTTDVMPESYATPLKNAKAGQTVGPFQAEGGWAILRVEDRRAEKPLTLEETRPQILRFLTYDEVRQLLQKLRGQAKIQILIKSDPSKLPGAPVEPASAPPPALRPPEPGPVTTPPDKPSVTRSVPIAPAKTAPAGKPK